MQNKISFCSQKESYSKKRFVDKMTFKKSFHAVLNPKRH